MADLKQFAEQLVNLTVKEVNELATILKDEYGIEPAAAAVVVAAGGGAADAAEEKTAFTVVLKSGGASKLNVVGPGTMTEQDAIRVIRRLGGNPDSLMNKELVAQALSEIYSSRYKQYEYDLGNYNSQVDSMENFESSQKKINETIEKIESYQFTNNDNNTFSPIDLLENKNKSKKFFEINDNNFTFFFQCK
jgi:hypothetical protein